MNINIFKAFLVLFCLISPLYSLAENLSSATGSLSDAQEEQDQSFSEVTFYGNALLRELYQFKYNSNTDRIEKIKIPFCEAVGLNGSLCRFQITSGEPNSVLVASLSAIYALSEDDAGIWQGQTIDFTPVTDGTVWQISHMGVDGDVAIVVMVTEDNGIFQSTLVSMVRGVNGLWSVARSESASGLYTNEVFQEIVFYDNHFVITNTRDSKFLVYEFTQDGEFSVSTTLVPDCDAHGLFPTQLIAHDLYESTMLVGGNGGYGSAPGDACMYSLSENNQWQKTQQLEMPDGEYFSFGQQVYLAKDTAVVVSLRSSSQFEYEPNYHVYKRDTSDSWQLSQTIESISNYKLNCLDCIFSQKIRWQAHLLEPYLFLPVVSDDGNRDGFSYKVYDLAASSDLNHTADGSSEGQNTIVENDTGGGLLDWFSLCISLFLFGLHGRHRRRDQH